MSINIESEASCRQAYLNYHCYGNSMNITAREMGMITSRWENYLQTWQESVGHVSNDENEYDFDDSDYASYKDNGKNKAKDATGYEGGKGNIVGRGVGDAVGGAANVAVSTFGQKFVGKLASNISFKVYRNTSNEGSLNLLPSRNSTGHDAQGGSISQSNSVQDQARAAGKNAENKVKNIGIFVACAMSLASGITYMAKKPNKEQVNACEELAEKTLSDAQQSLDDTQCDMEEMSRSLVELSDEATEENESANEEIEEKKTEFDMYRAAYDVLKAKAENNETLSDDEKALYKQCCKYMADISEDITDTQENTTETVGEIYDDMDTYQDGYDSAAESMGEVEGITDFAESFDGATRTMCYVEAAAQTLNVAGATLNAKKAISMATATSFWGIGAAYWAAAAAAGAGGVMSGAGVLEQMDWAGKVGGEIDMRKSVQDLNTATSDMYDENVDDYASLMQGVEDLEMEIPDDITPPEETPLPESSNPFAYPKNTPDAVKPKKGEEES